MNRKEVYKKRRLKVLHTVLKTIKKYNRNTKHINFNFQRVKYDVEKLFKI